MANPTPQQFTAATALERVKFAQNAWNSKDPERIIKGMSCILFFLQMTLTVLGYTRDCIWRNRDIFLQGHDEIVAFLTAKYHKELGYHLRKELFAFQDNKIAVQFFYEYHDTTGQWYRAYGLEDWTFETEGEEKGKMRKRMSSINDLKISEEERWFIEGVDVDTIVISEKHL